MALDHSRLLDHPTRMSRIDIFEAYSYVSIPANPNRLVDLGGLIEGRVAGLFLPACSFVVSSMPWFLSIRLRSLIFHCPSGLVSL